MDTIHKETTDYLKIKTNLDRNQLLKWKPIQIDRWSFFFIFILVSFVMYRITKRSEHIYI